MFTGIVQDIGRVESREPRGGDERLIITTDKMDLSRVAIGDSICVQGVCLTVAELQGKSFAADASRETLSLTTLGELAPGSVVNLEPALRAGDPLGGHLFCFLGRSGNLLKVIWHDGQGACLFTKRLERGRFLWPSMADGVVTISVAQLSYLLSGIDWRMPQATWRPQASG